MKIRGFATGLAAMLCIFIAAVPVVYGQDPTATGLVCTPDDVHYGTSVEATATFTNNGKCFIVLGDPDDPGPPPVVGDQVSYNFESPVVYGYKIKVTMRSSSAGYQVTATVWIDNYPSTFLYTSDGTWVERTALYPYPANELSNDDHVLYVRFSGSVGGARLELDKVSVIDYSNVAYLTREAEANDGGDGDIDAIHPSSVTVRFYDGYPYSGGTSFGSAHYAYDKSKSIEGGSSFYLTENGSDTISETWNSTSPGFHTIYANIDATSYDLHYGNNMADDDVAVYANLTIDRPYSGGTTIPLPGTYTYYGGSSDPVTANASPNCSFVRWELDEIDVGGTNPYCCVSMNADHLLEAIFSNTLPNAVTLTGFTAMEQDGSIALRWETKSEIDNLGFNLFRSTGMEESRTAINVELIPAKGDELRGADYSFIDRDVIDGVTYYYWIEDVSLSGKNTPHGPVKVLKKVRTPEVFSLTQNYPNPFNPITEIRYDLPEICHVRLEVYNVAGQLVATLVNATQDPGKKVARWNGTNERGLSAAAGVYFYKLQAGDFVGIKKMLLLR